MRWILFIIGLVVVAATSPGRAGVDYTFPTAELMSAEFAAQSWGSGTLSGRTANADGSVSFIFTLGTAADAGKTVIGDQWQISSAAGLAWDGGYLPGTPDEPHAAEHDNVSIYDYTGIRLPVGYVSGPGPITMKLFMNTGMTGPSGYPVSDYRNNTAWTSAAVSMVAGAGAELRLDFSSAQAWGAADNPAPHSGAGEAWADGSWQAINERDLREVTNFGFEIYGPAGAEVILVVYQPIPEPVAALGLLLCGGLAGLIMRRPRID